MNIVMSNHVKIKPSAPVACLAGSISGGGMATIRLPLLELVQQCDEPRDSA